MARDFFNDLGATLSKTAQDFSGKVGAMYETGKARGKISGEEQMIQKIMADLGKIVYQRYLNGAQVDPELTELCRKIRQHEEKIDRLNREMANVNNKKICPRCKKSVEQEAAFCPYCGNQLPLPEEKYDRREQGTPVQDEFIDDPFDFDEVEASGETENSEDADPAAKTVNEEQTMASEEKEEAPAEEEAVKTPAEALSEAFQGNQGDLHGEESSDSTEEFHG